MRYKQKIRNLILHLKDNLNQEARIKILTKVIPSEKVPILKEEDLISTDEKKKR